MAARLCRLLRSSVQSRAPTVFHHLRFRLLLLLLLRCAMRSRLSASLFLRTDSTCCSMPWKSNVWFFRVEVSYRTAAHFRMLDSVVFVHNAATGNWERAVRLHLQVWRHRSRGNCKLTLLILFSASGFMSGNWFFDFVLLQPLRLQVVAHCTVLNDSSVAWRTVLWRIWRLPHDNIALDYYRGTRIACLFSMMYASDFFLSRYFTRDFLMYQHLLYHTLIYHPNWYRFIHW